MSDTGGATPGAALWNLGFRPFYLCAGAFAAISIALWTCEYAGVLPFRYVGVPLRHGHEMLFGYALAVVTGFLFTAVRNWTGAPTPSGRLLAAYVALWLAGRILVLTPFTAAAAIANALFVFAVALGIGVPLARAANRRNYFFIALLAGLACATVAVHLALLQVITLPPMLGMQAALDILLFLMAVMGGRVIPMFTNNGVAGAGAVRLPWVERSALGLVLALIAADLMQAGPAATATCAGAAAVVHALRLALWRPWRTGANPLVWILHAGYGWIVVHLALRAAASFDLVAASIAIHALTVGAIGSLSIGMMVRTARGHTGRPLAADRCERACFALIQAAAVARVFGAAWLPQAYLAVIGVSAACWCSAFTLYAVHHWPVLARPRVDGKPG